jgi:hypothetical protein
VLLEPPPDPTNPNAAPSNTGTVFETDAFTIRGLCTNHPISPEPAVNLQVVPKQEGISAVTITREGSTTPFENYNVPAGQQVEIASILVEGDVTSDVLHTYGSYIVVSPGGFLEGRVTLAIVSEGPNRACRFSATGLGQ